MALYQEEQDPFEEDIVFDKTGLLNSTAKMNSAIQRVSSGKCVLFAKTLGLCGAFFGLGLCIAIPGPTFLSPVTELKTDISPISNVYASRSCGFLIGSIMGGMLFDRFNRLFLLFISLLMTSVLITITPWCHVLWVLEAVMVVLGVSMGFLNTGGNVLCLDLWGRNSGPFMQALHFSFGLGAFVAPLLATPFLETSSISVIPSNATLPELSLSMPLVSLSNNISTRQRRQTTENETDFLEKTEIFLEDRNLSMFLPTINAIKSEMTSTAKPPKRHKPSITDGSKLGDINWEKVPVRKPDPADLVVIATTTSTTLSSTSDTNHEMLTTVSSPATSQNDMLLLGGSSLSKFNDSYSFVNSNSNTVSATPDGVSTETHSSIQDIFSSVIFSSLSGVNEKGKSLYRSNNYSRNTTDLNIVAHTESLDHNMLPETNNNQSKIISKVSVGKNMRILESSLLPESHNYTSMRSPKMLTTISSSVSYENFSQLQGKGTILRQSSNNAHVTKMNSADNMEYYVDSSESVNNPQNYLLVTEQRSSVSTLIPLEVTSNLTLMEAPTTLVPKHIHHFKPGTYDNDTEDINTIFDVLGNRIEKYGFSKIQFTYLIVGLFVFIISLVFLGFLCHNPRDPKSKQEGQISRKIPHRLLHGFLIVLMTLFFLLSCGLKAAYGQLVLAFAVHSNLQITQSTGSMIAISFEGSFTSMRFASIFFASCFSPFTMLILNFIMCMVGIVILAILSNIAETALWVGTVFLGVGLASMLPTGILWIERYIHISNKIAALFVIGVSLGEMICPIILYNFMVANSILLMYSTLVINIICILIFLTLWRISLKHGEKYAIITNNGYQLANQNDEEEDMIDMSPSTHSIGIGKHSFSSEHRSLLNGNFHRGP